MRKISIVSVLCFLVVGIIFSNFNNQVFAQKIAIQQWEYGSITMVYYIAPEREKINKIIGIVEFCEMTNSGCQRLEFSHELDYANYLKDAALPETYDARVLASRKAAEIAFQKALAKLGNSGWEMISEPTISFGFVDLYTYEKYDDKTYIFSRDNVKGIYFKRLKNRTYNGKE